MTERLEQAVAESLDQPKLAHNEWVFEVGAHRSDKFVVVAVSCSVPELKELFDAVIHHSDESTCVGAARVCSHTHHTGQAFEQIGFGSLSGPLLQLKTDGMAVGVAAGAQQFGGSAERLPSSEGLRLLLGSSSGFGGGRLRDRRGGRA